MRQLSIGRSSLLVLPIVVALFAVTGCDSGSPDNASRGAASASSGFIPFPKEFFLSTRFYNSVDTTGVPQIEAFIYYNPKVCLTDLSEGKTNQGTICNDDPPQVCPPGNMCFTSGRSPSFSSNYAAQFDPAYEQGSFPISLIRGRPYRVQICGQGYATVITVGTAANSEVRLEYFAYSTLDAGLGVYVGSYNFTGFLPQIYGTGSSVTYEYYTHPLNTGIACS